MKRISIVVPCYNESETINLYYNEVIKYLDPSIDFKIIFVNDGSKDNTLELIKELAEKDKRVLYVSLSRNFGKEAAMYAGLEAAKMIKSDAMINMDVDLQDPPYLIPDLIKYHDEGYNLIITRHKNRNGEGFLKKLFSLSFYKVYAFVTKDKGLSQGARDYALLDKKVIDAFLEIRDFERFTKGIYNFVGFRTKIVEFNYEPRVAGKTKWNFKKLFHYGVMGMREFSRFYEYIPKVFGWLFTFLLMFDVGYGIYQYCANDVAFNWRRIIFDLGMIMIFITLFYICRLIYDIRRQIQNRPIYLAEDSNIEKED
ncbi:MAG: glycosyltransferase family 2 protein [Acholeplasmatales bacterium]|nr:glycosyltransferase family 2 protein [Acholeplasmatales bacterium]